MARSEPNNGKWSDERSELHTRMLAKFHAHGFRGPCSECGFVPFSSYTVMEWVAHYYEDEIIKIKKLSGGRIT